MSSVLLVSPTGEDSLTGNGVTARRWRRMLEQLGHSATIAREFEGQPCDLLVALHARRSASSVARYREARPDAPLVLALTGTDLYGDIAHDTEARRSLELATCFILLQPVLPDSFPAHLRSKTHVIYQSIAPPADPGAPPRTGFDLCVLGHLRRVKDPLRTSEATRLLPPTSRCRVVHLGGALEEGMAERAAAEARDNPRYSWRGEVPHEEALRILARSHLHVLTSEMESGANALCEAIALGVPSLCARIDGSVGILGEDYPGFFAVGDTEGLARAILRAETDADFYASLKKWCEDLRDLVSPERELASWAALMQEVISGAEEGT